MNTHSVYLKHLINTVSIILILVLCVCVCPSVRLSVRPREISGTERRIAALLSPA